MPPTDYLVLVLLLLAAHSAATPSFSTLASSSDPSSAFNDLLSQNLPASAWQQLVREALNLAPAAPPKPIPKLAPRRSAAPVDTRPMPELPTPTPPPPPDFSPPIVRPTYTPPSRKELGDTCECSPSLRAALVALYNATAGDGWASRDGWLDADVPCTQWFGVSCGPRLHMKRNNLVGTLPAELWSMETPFVRLDLSYNAKLSGSLPAWFRMPQGVEYLLLMTDIEGVLPPTLEMQPHSFLSFYRTRLSGTLPPSLHLPEFAVLDVDRARVTGVVPPNLTLALGAALWVANSGVSGTFPSTLRSLPHGAALNAFNSRVSGTLPADLYMGANSSVLMHATPLTGTIPSGVTLLRGSTLSLHESWVSGTIPSTLSVGPHARFYAQTMRLSGTLPRNLSLPIGSLFSVYSTYVSGTLPESFTLAPHARAGLYKIALSGTIPSSMRTSVGSELYLFSTYVSGQLPNLTVPPHSRLHIYNSRLSSTLPETFAVGAGAGAVLTNTLITGTLPAAFSTGENSTLVLTSAISGTLPPGFSAPLNSIAFYFGSRLSGTLPPSFRIGPLARLWLSESRISGTLAPDLEFPYGSAFFVYGTLLSGALPDPCILHPKSVALLYNTRIAGRLPTRIEMHAHSNLYANGLRINGTLPAHLTLEKDAHLFLGDTDVSGPIPHVTLHDQSVLWLFNTAVEGTLSQTMTLGSSAELHVADTAISGVLPPTLLSPQPTSRFFGFDTLIEGTLPERLILRDSITSLAESRVSGAFPLYLHVSGSSELILTGTPLDPSPLPSTIHASPGSHLTLDVSGLRVQGELPGDISNLSSISIDATASDVTGTISAQLAQRAIILRAANSYVHGTLPSMSQCVDLSLSSTLISGTVPDNLHGRVSLSSTAVSSTLPASLLDGRVNHLELVRTKISGSIPSSPVWLGAGLDLALLDLNFLSGSIPEALCGHSSLKLLSLVGNANITGRVPGCLGRTLRRLNLDQTGITEVDPSLFESDTLRVLGLGNTHAHIDIHSDTSPLCAALRSKSLIHEIDLSGHSTETGARAPLGTYMRCLVDGSQVSSVRLRHVDFQTDICEEWDGDNILTGRFLRSFDCNLLYPSSHLRSLDLSHSGLLTLRVDGFPGDRAIAESDFPSLTTLDVSHNPSLTGRIPSAWALLNDLDISTTNFDICASRPIFSSTRLHRLTIRNVSSPWSRCFPLVIPEERALLRRSSQSTSDPQRGGLQCPVWTLTNSLEGGFVNADSTFLDFHGCMCPVSLYFGQRPSYHVSAQSWLNYRKAARSFRCEACPHNDTKSGEALVCDPTSSPSAPALHRLVGSRYPMYRIGAAWAFLPERWRLVHSALVECQHPDVCNVASHSETAVNVTCRAGHESSTFLCSRCKYGYFQVGLLCEACPDSAKWLVPLSFMLAALAFVAFLRLRNFARPGIAVSIWFFWLQLEGILTRVNQQLEAGYDVGEAGSGQRGFMAPVQDVLQALATFHPFALQCVDHGAGFIVQTNLLLLTPVFMLAAFVVAFTLFKEWRWRTLNGRWAGVAELYEEWVHRPRWGTSLLFTWSIMLFPIAHRSFEMFACDDAETVGESYDVDVSYLRAAPWIECNSPDHIKLILLAVAALVVFVIPFMVFLAHRLSSFRDHKEEEAPLATLDDMEMYELLDDDEQSVASTATMRSRSGTSTHMSLICFLTASLRPTLWWWPVAVQQMRALMLATVIALVPFHSVYLQMGIFAILLASLLLHVAVQPYHRLQDNNLETMVLVSALLRYMLSMLAGLDNSTSPEDVAALGSLLSIAVAACVLFVLSGRVRRMMRRFSSA